MRLNQGELVFPWHVHSGTVWVGVFCLFFFLDTVYPLENINIINTLGCTPWQMLRK